jgi:hypothetical protein
MTVLSGGCVETGRVLASFPEPGVLREFCRLGLSDCSDLDGQPFLSRSGAKWLW